ncbi:MAG: gfo/Idh/MocA family oxidoreductase [Verrucomicrobia bacterium]|nr:MAG: gfo/Idh/MocA family oxidoreductase [Verrucomicrobiota bacterium]
MADQNRPIRIGIIGAGKNTRVMHLPGFQSIEGVSVDLVCNRSEASSRRVADEFGIARIESDWRKLVADPEIDAVMIGTWPYLHADATIAALRSGKHVLTEARMACNLGEAESMLAISREFPDLITQIVPAPMSLDFDAVVIKLLADKALGDLREVCVTHTGSQFASAEAPMTWRQDAELSGHNVLTMGIYYEIVRRWLRVDPVQVVATGAVFTRTRPRPESDERGEVSIPESVTALGEYADGARLVAHFSGVENGLSRNEIRLNGSEGSLRIDFSTKRLYRSNNGATEEIEVPVPEKVRRGWRVEADFIDSIRNGTPVTLTNFEDGIGYMAFTEAVAKSIEAGGATQKV